ncbi:MAG: hypothetical protein ACRD5K_19310 [Candidatus Acidiferrales bacterium]
MRNRLFFAGTVMILSASIVFAGKKKNANWIDEPFTQWTQKQVSELFNKSAWAKTKSFRGQVANVNGAGAASAAEHGGGAGSYGTGGSVTQGVDVPDYTFTARFLSALPIREAYVRMLEIMNHYKTMPAARQKEFDQKVDGLLHADVSQEVTITLYFQANDPVSQRNLNEWFNTQTTDTLKQNAYLYTPAGQVPLLKYLPPSEGGGLGARFVFARTFNGEPILEPTAKGRVRFQLSYQPQINQMMYIDFKPEDMIYKGQLSY